jgi:hypothetical protein
MLSIKVICSKMTYPMEAPKVKDVAMNYTQRWPWLKNWKCTFWVKQRLILCNSFAWCSVLARGSKNQWGLNPPHAQLHGKMTQAWKMTSPCKLSVKAIWSKKKTFHGVMFSVQAVVLILTSSDLPLNLLCDLRFLSKDNFHVFVKFENESLQVVLTSMNLVRRSKWIFQSFCKARAEQWQIFVFSSHGVPYLQGDPRTNGS